MAIKKNELYSSLWASCDKLRGGMDASQYKDYILTLLFVKYVTDKFKGVKYADITVPDGGSFDDIVDLKGRKNIGEGIDVIIAKLAEANELRGVIDNAHFNDEAKLGKGQEMVDKLTGLVAIFQRDEFNFKNNKAGGDDILGDAYEYLMRNFATESGKSKGQFYTPAEVSRILAKVVGIDRITRRDEGYTIYDPACGSGSLLIRAADEAPFEISIWGQEKETTTAGLAKMNLVLHNKAAGEIKAANTFSDPQYFEEGSNDEVLKRFDFAVVNPPFSLKNWTDGLKEYGRFDGYGDRPPEKNGDFAWLMHILKSLKSTGKAAVILPHGVLFRGNAEATIRQSIIDKGYIKGIIGLPANLFYGTGIPACILVIDKSDADERQGIFMIDASHDYIKDGNKNRLRERDIYKIVTTFNQRITDDPKYARFVPNDEIKIKNQYWYEYSDSIYIPVTADSKLGFASRTTGEIVIPCRYSPDDSRGFSGDFCMVMPVDSEIADGLLIDRKGREIPLPEHCFASGTFRDGLALVWNCETDLCGYIDMQGNAVIEPQYEWAYEFSEGLACVKQSSGEYAMITPDGRTAFTRWDEADARGSSMYCSHGLIRCAAPDGGPVVFLNPSGDEVFRLEIEGLEAVSDFKENGVAFYEVHSDQLIYNGGRGVGLFNDKGEILTPPIFLGGRRTLA